ITSASFVMPAAAASANISISNTGWIGVGQEIYIAGAGYFNVQSITSPTIFVGTNSNYPGGATPGSTIASGARVSPAGVIGPAGAGGAGLNAVITLSANFTQPPVNATVPITVGTTAWMAPTQAIYIAGGGYYTVSSITDITHAVVTNLGYSGNAAPGATVASGGAVSPSGLNGAAGSNAFTSTTANFTMPTSGSTVTVTVAATSWMAQGQNLFIPGAGYFSVSVVTDATHAVLTNSGTTGNATAGTVISSGAQVSPAGAQGSGGTGGGGGGVRSLTDATTTGTSWITSPTGVLKRVVQGGNITLTDSGTSVTIAASSGGGVGSSADIFQGLYFQDDFITMVNLATAGWSSNVGAGGVAIVKTTYGQDATRKFLGSIELACSTGTSGTNGSGLCIGQSNNQPATSGD